MSRILGLEIQGSKVWADGSGLTRNRSSSKLGPRKRKRILTRGVKIWARRLSFFILLAFVAVPNGSNIDLSNFFCLLQFSIVFSTRTRQTRLQREAAAPPTTGPVTLPPPTPSIADPFPQVGAMEPMFLWSRVEGFGLRACHSAMARPTHEVVVPRAAFVPWIPPTATQSNTFHGFVPCALPPKRPPRPCQTKHSGRLQQGTGPEKLAQHSGQPWRGTIRDDSGEDHMLG